MATWSDLIGYVRSNYKIADEQPGMVKMIFETENLRSQVVLLWRRTLMDGNEEWLQIESPFAETESVNLREALEEMGRAVCGGMAIVSNYVTVRHAVPLANLNINEFERPLILVTSTADYLEQKLAGGDKY
jgi:hypothetical protein